MPKKVVEVKKACEKKIPVKEVIVKKKEVAKVVRKEISRKPHVVQIAEPLPARVTRSSQETNTRSERVTRRVQVTPQSRSPPEVKAEVKAATKSVKKAKDFKVPQKVEKKAKPEKENQVIGKRLRSQLVVESPLPQRAARPKQPTITVNQQVTNVRQTRGGNAIAKVEPLKSSLKKREVKQVTKAETKEN